METGRTGPGDGGFALLLGISPLRARQGLGRAAIIATRRALGRCRQ